MGGILTSQVAVSNFYGVAVASDTVSSRETAGGLKTVTHTNKIYELGPRHEVLVLHSGSSVTNNVPSWLLVAEWSKTLSGPLETVQDYIDSFIRWANEASPLHSETSEMESISWRLDSHFASIARAVNSDLRALNEANAVDKKTVPNPRDLLISNLEANIKQLKSQPVLDAFSADNASAIVGSVDSSTFERQVRYWFNQFGVEKQDFALIKKSSSFALQAAYYLSDGDSYLAFVGFGSTQAFPSNRVLQCRAYYDGVLRCIQKDPQDYSPRGALNAGIDFFAQSYAIEGFLRGYREQILMQIGTFVSEALQVKASAQIGDDLASKIVDQVIANTRDFAQKSYVEPLFGEVQGMNASRLAEFAESLVGLQAIAAKSEDGPATVGGLIEVATIDKANGVRWIKSLDARRVG
jgi:hypothetical protein